MPVRSGLTSSIEHAVTAEDTALALRTGEVPVLATPRVIALMEEVAVAAIAGQLEDGLTSVSVRVQVEHVSPTPVGATVRADATLDRVEGRRLRFKVSVRDDRGLVAAGKVTRVVVDSGRFMEKVR